MNSDIRYRVSEALSSLYAIRKSGAHLTTEDRYSFTNDADAREVEQAIGDLNEAIRLIDMEDKGTDVEGST